MINSRFTYASVRVGFGSAFGSGSTAWQKLKSNRAGIASSLAATQSALASFTNAMSSAQQDRISGLATLTAKAAIARVQAAAKAKADEITKKIDSAQKTIDGSKSASASKDPIIVGNTIIQPYVSWVYSPPVSTTDTSA
jgi:hypothetical protein